MLTKKQDIKKEKDMEISRIAEEASTFLSHGDKAEFAEKWGVSLNMVRAVLAGRSKGPLGISRLLELHERAKENRKNLKSTSL